MANDTTFRVENAVLELQRFTVAELCAYAELRRPQVDPVLAALKKEGLVVEDDADQTECTKVPAHRPAGTCRITEDSAARQVLIDRVYRLGRTLRQDARGGEQTPRSVQSAIEHVELLLDLCESATTWKKLTRDQLRKVESELQSLYTRLEKETFAAALDLQSPDNAAHPLVLAWDRWKAGAALLHQIAVRWKRADQSADLARVITPQAGNVRVLQVVTDPRFIDSALFLWIFAQQPFRAIGLDIECVAIERTWSEVAGYVGSQANAIGFYNGRRAPDDPTRNVDYWSDLCIYRGYAVLAHPGLGLTRRPATLALASKFLLRFCDHWQRKGDPPRLITIGADTFWRFETSLAPGVGRARFRDEQRPDANAALEEFRRTKNALFIGGLPQRLKAEQAGFIRVLDERHDPELFSVNGLIFNRALGFEASAMLQSAASIWFATVARMKSDRDYRLSVAASMRAMFKSDLPGTAVPFEDYMFDRTFGSDELEIFPTTPAEITRIVAERQMDVLRATLQASGATSDARTKGPRRSSGADARVNRAIKATTKPFSNDWQDEGTRTPRTVLSVVRTGTDA